MNPGHSPTLVDLGRLRERLHDDAGADEYYRQAIAADTNNSFAYYLLARLTYRYNDIEEAFRLAKTAMTTDPLDERNRQLVKELKQKLMPPE
jgi:tetratricopeptide (TPR) repeat protein